MVQTKIIIKNIIGGDAQRFYGVIAGKFPPAHKPAIVTAEFCHRFGNHPRWISVVNNPGIWIDRFDILCDLQHGWNSAQGFEHPPRTGGFLADHAVFEWDLFIQDALGVPANSDLSEHKLGIPDRFATVAGGLYFNLAAKMSCQPAADPVMISNRSGSISMKVIWVAGKRFRLR